MLVIGITLFSGWGFFSCHLVRMWSVAEYTLARTGYLREKRMCGHGVCERTVSVNQKRLMQQIKKDGLKKDSRSRIDSSGSSRRTIKEFFFISFFHALLMVSHSSNASRRCSTRACIRLARLCREWEVVNSLNGNRVLDQNRILFHIILMLRFMQLRGLLKQLFGVYMATGGSLVKTAHLIWLWGAELIRWKGPFNWTNERWRSKYALFPGTGFMYCETTVWLRRSCTIGTTN